MTGHGRASDQTVTKTMDVVKAPVIDLTGDSTHDTESYSCDICGKSGFTGVRALAGHKSVHSRNISTGESKKTQQECSKETKPLYHCMVCGKPFSKKSRLHEHQSNHQKYPYYLEEETPTCKLCGDKLSKFAFHRHKCFLVGIGGIEKKNKTNSKPKKIYDCAFCGKSYALYHPFSVHMKKHDASEQPLQMTRYQCDFCEKQFKKKYSYEHHLLIHSGVKPFSCGRCGKTFRTKGDLQRHETFHTGDLQHSCDICNKSFSCKWDLEEHRYMELFCIKRYPMIDDMVLRCINVF